MPVDHVPTRPARVLRPLVRIALLAFVVVLVAGLALRVWGEEKFAIVPHESSAISTERSPATTPIDDRSASDDVDAFRTLGPAGEALEARLALADHATRTLDVQYYGFHHDASGRALLGRLAGAAERGVAVRLLLDDIGIGRRADCLARLAARVPGLAIRIFNPTALRGGARLFEFVARFPRASRRMHNKAMTADRAVSIVGGRNISDLYFDGDDVDVGFADFDVLVAGPVASEIVDSFDAYWESGIAFGVERVTTTERDEDCGPEVVPTDASAISRSALMSPSATTGAEEPGTAEAPLEAIDRDATGDGTGPFTTDATLVVDPPDKVVTPLGESVDHSGTSVARLLASAGDELLLSSPYFVPGGRGMPLFAELRARGVRVSILTNSLASNDVPAVHASYAGYRKALLRLGVELHEFKPLTGESRDWSLLESERASLHAKTFVVDAARIFVGSFNLDPRSFFHNTEMGIVLENADFGHAIRARWTALLPQVAYRLELDEDDEIRWHETLDDGGERIHRHDPMTTATERLTTRALSWLPIGWLM